MLLTKIQSGIQMVSYLTSVAELGSIYSVTAGIEFNKDRTQNSMPNATTKITML